MIEAAGGVIWRINADHELEILLIHRPHAADWSLPKGKLRRSEPPLDGALREVREETGLRCETGPALPATIYRDGKGRDKRVRYWAMRALSGRFKPNREVDQVRWCTLPAAAATLSYERDVAVVAALDQLLASVA